MIRPTRSVRGRPESWRFGLPNSTVMNSKTVFDASKMLSQAVIEVTAVFQWAKSTRSSSLRGHVGSSTWLLKKKGTFADPIAPCQQNSVF